MNHRASINANLKLFKIIYNPRNMCEKIKTIYNPLSNNRFQGIWITTKKNFKPNQSETHPN